MGAPGGAVRYLPRSIFYAAQPPESPCSGIFRGGFWEESFHAKKAASDKEDQQQRCPRKR